METIKNFTSIEQSKVLAKILPLDSADMKILPFGIDIKRRVVPIDDIAVLNREDEIPCWSLAALLSVLPKGEYRDTDLCFGGYKGEKYIQEWFCSYEQQEPFIIKICHAPNPVDACYEMILKLHEQKLL